MPFGAFGSVATAARLLRLDRQQTATALGYAAHTAMGLAESDLGPISHYYGMVCRNGLTGAYLARAGAWSSPTVLEGRFGFIEAFLGSAEVDQDTLVASLGHDYAVMQSCEKRYPGTGLNQVPIEMMRQLVREHGLRPADIARIEVDFPIERRNFGGGHGKGPFSRGTTSSSVAFQFALLLLDGDLRLERYDQLDNPEILQVVDRCEFAFVAGKSIRYARLGVRTTDGRVFEREGDEFFFEPETHRAMVERGAVGLLPQAQIERFLELLDRLEALDDASELVRCLIP
jgi:2-methylcitrate dehydratase PrpD